MVLPCFGSCVISFLPHSWLRFQGSAYKGRMSRIVSQRLCSYGKPIPIRVSGRRHLTVKLLQSFKCWNYSIKHCDFWLRFLKYIYFRFIYVFLSFSCIYVCTPHVCRVWRSEDGIRSLKADVCEPSCGVLGIEPRYLGKQPLLLIIEPSP